ncbi:hypothetical protein [Bradyrhizobium sp. WSM2793]|nr:hypothetical protein [Bradyrhizobium sp. WSM2793]
MNQEIELSPLRLHALEHGFIGEIQISIAMFDLVVVQGIQEAPRSPRR